MMIKFSNGSIALLLLGIAALGCSSLKNMAGKQDPAPPANATNAGSSNTGSSTSDNTSSNSVKKPAATKADFEYTSEELDQIFTKKGVTDKDLEKFANKTIAVSGRVSMLVTDKRGTVQPWVTLYAPGTLHGVSCYFDDADVDQMKSLKEDKMAKVQGFQNDFIVPEISPRLEHCIVLESN